MLQEDIWQSIQESIEERTGCKLLDATLAKYQMKQFLAPGILCQQALSHALLELDEPRSSYNDSLQQVQRHLTAAAQVGLFPSHQLYTSGRSLFGCLLHTQLSSGCLATMLALQDS